MINNMGDSFVTSFAEMEGELLAAHSYLVDKELGIARLFHSASRRLDQRFDRNIIGRANKLLTARDIFHFREEGFQLMDFGGYAENTQDKKPAGHQRIQIVVWRSKSPLQQLFHPALFVLRNYRCCLIEDTDQQHKQKWLGNRINRYTTFVGCK